MGPIGVVVKTPSIYYYIFKPFRKVDVGTFVSTDVDGTGVLSRVVAVRYKNAAVDPRLVAQFDESNIEEIKGVLGIEESLYYTEAKAVVLGAKMGKKIYRPQKPVKPLTYVYKATEEELEEFFAPPEEGITIGKIRGTEIPAKIDAERLVTHHCSILASTGAGKSWLAGVLIERLSLLEIPIIVLDPHGEYSAMSIPIAEEGEKVAEKVRIYVVGKVDTEPIDQAFRQRYGRPRSYVRIGINPRSLPLRTLEKILDTTYGLTEAQKRVLEEGWQYATGYGERQPLTSVEELVKEVVEGGRHAAPPSFAGEMTARGLEGRLKALFYGSRVFISRYGETYLGEPLRLIDPPTYVSTPFIHIFDVSSLEDL
ncbi:MAG: helicase HerA domain-containing protein, partial [Pyrobaculum sp.]